MAKDPTRTKRTYPFQMFAVPRERVVRIYASSGDHWKTNGRGGATEPVKERPTTERRSTAGHRGWHPCSRFKGIYLTPPWPGQVPATTLLLKQFSVSFSSSSEIGHTTLHIVTRTLRPVGTSKERIICPLEIVRWPIGALAPQPFDSVEGPVRIAV